MIVKFSDSMRLGLASHNEDRVIVYYFIHENLVAMLHAWVASHNEVPTNKSGVIPHSGGLTSDVPHIRG